MASFPAVYLHSAVALQAKNESLVFGGLDEFSQVTNDLLRVDVDNLLWWHDTRHSVPVSSRYAHSAVLANGAEVGRFEVS